jgi:hypothetical protein
MHSATSIFFAALAWSFGTIQQKNTADNSHAMQTIKVRACFFMFDGLLCVGVFLLL